MMNISMNSVYYAIGIVLLFIIIKHVLSNKKLYAATWKCDGPLSLSVYIVLYVSWIQPNKLVNFFIKLFRRYKGPLFTWVGCQPVICLRTPDDFQTVLTNPNCLEKSEFYKLFPFDSLGTVPVEKWKKRRKLIQPSFNQKFVVSFMTIFNEQSRACAKECEKYVNDKNFEISLKSVRYLTKVYCDTQLSIPAGVVEELIEKIKRILDICSIRIAKHLYFFDFIFNRSSLGRVYKKLSREIMENIEKIIVEKRKTMNENTNNQGCTGRIKTIIDTLMDSPEALLAFTDQDLANFISEVLFVGVDTTNITLSGTLMMISMHPEVQDKLVDELDGIFGNENRDVNAEDIKQAEYLDRVVKESLRVCPVANFLGRKTISEVKFQTMTLPAGVNVILNILDMHRSPEYWENPLKFNPDRFLPEEVAKRHPYCFLPFSLGPRNCVGYVFGLLSVKTFIINLLRKYHLTNNKYKNIEDIKFKWSVSLHVAGGSGIVLEKRNNDYNN